MQIHIRNVRMSDVEMVWKWRNSSDARINSNDNSPIGLNGHRAWMLARVESLSSNPFWICESINTPIGYLRLDETNFGSNHFKVSIFLIEKFRGLGIGKRLLNFAILEMRRKNQHFILQADVLKKNTASLKMFQSLNFSLSHESINQLIFLFDSNDN